MSTMKLPLGGEYCTPITDHAGMSVGDRITFLVARIDGRMSVSGVIRELYLEKHPSTLNWRPDGAAFAEVELDDGRFQRCWFWRDKPYLAGDLDGVVGAAPEGAMF